ncbi:MAG TPA: hypothetical protein VIL97_02020 [Thermoanaerobaculia bacterium]
MTTTGRRLLFWTPRALAILFAMFLGVFALDVFGEAGGAWKTLVAFLIHLVPAFIVAIGLMIAWRREWIGALLFFALAAGYVAMTLGRFPLVTYATISGPLVVIAVLFLINWRYRAELRTR